MVNLSDSLSELFEGVQEEEETLPQGEDDTAEPTAQEEVDSERKLDENPELESMKKFLLIQKLQKLNSALMSHDILNNSLTTFLEFCATLSYDTILSVSNGFVEYISKNMNTLTTTPKEGGINER